VTIDRETWMRAKRHHVPGEPAPATGDYEQQGVFGAATGVRVTVPAGQPLPAAPIGFTWTLARIPGAATPGASPPRRQGQHTEPAARQLRAEAELYRRMAARAQTATARNELEALALRLEAAAAELEAMDPGEPGDQPSEARKLGCC
jgi:hypothetical protein